MLRKKISSILSAHHDELARFHVKSLFIFGSIARDEAGPDSDVDILVFFEGPATFDQYMDLKFFLEDLIGRKVDLVTENGLRDELKEYVEKDMIRVA